MTFKVLLVLVLGFVAVFGLPRPQRHHDRDYDYGHHDHHRHPEFEHHHDGHHGGHHGGHHHSGYDHSDLIGDLTSAIGGFRPHHDHRFRRAASPEALNGVRRARHHGGGFDAPPVSFGEHGDYQGLQLRKHKRPIYVHKKTGFSSSSAIAQSINTPYGVTHTISKAHAHSGTIDRTFGKKR